MNKAFCFLCHKAETEGKLKAANNYLSLITRGFLNRKDEVGATWTWYTIGE